ncbi:hypothetical protein AB0J47_17845 [Nocardia sp. NPDC049737]|uniref:hypothetical protein n=1 Tax=Nocardia sp. NPDC049737 TaxID=3154358 RepID=UPI003444C395
MNLFGVDRSDYDAAVAGKLELLLALRDNDSIADFGGLPAHMVSDSIELLATEIAPVIRRETRPPTPPHSANTHQQFVP